MRLNEVDTDYVVCRTLLHAWDEIPDDGGYGERTFRGPNVLRLLFRCTRCGTKRYEWWSAVTGKLLGRQYVYPDNYRMDYAKDRTRVAARVEYVRRLRASAKVVPIRRRA